MTDDAAEEAPGNVLGDAIMDLITDSLRGYATNTDVLRCAVKRMPELVSMSRKTQQDVIDEALDEYFIPSILDVAMGEYACPDYAMAVTGWGIATIKRKPLAKWDEIELTRAVPGFGGGGKRAQKSGVIKFAPKSRNADFLILKAMDFRIRVGSGIAQRVRLLGSRALDEETLVRDVIKMRLAEIEAELSLPVKNRKVTHRKNSA